MASGMWSVRVRNAVQSSKYLSSLLVTLLSFVTHSRKTRKKSSTNVLLGTVLEPTQTNSRML